MGDPEITQAKCVQTYYNASKPHRSLHKLYLSLFMPSLNTETQTRLPTTLTAQAGPYDHSKSASPADAG